MNPIVIVCFNCVFFTLVAVELAIIKNISTIANQMLFDATVSNAIAIQQLPVFLLVFIACNTVRYIVLFIYSGTDVYFRRAVMSWVFASELITTLLFTLLI